MGTSVKRLIKHSCGHEREHSFPDEVWAKHQADIIATFECRECRREKRMVSMPE